MNRTSLAALATSLGLALSACGGGGGSAAPSYSAPVTTVASVTYEQTYPQALAAFVPEVLTVSRGIQSARAGSSAGLLAQSAPLDAAALAHLSYLFTNNKVADGPYLSALQPPEPTLLPRVLGGHYEDSSLSGFTGRTPADRAVAAKYAGSVAEIVTFGAPSGAACIASLKNSVYHLIALMSPFLDVGIAFRDEPGIGSACVVEMGTPDSSLGQLPAKGTYIFYPADGHTGVPPVFYNRAEVPSPAVDLSIAGHPVLVSLYTQELSSLSANAIRVRAFSIRPSAIGSQPVAARVLARTGVTADAGVKIESDDNIIGSGYLVLLPEVPLDPLTEYQVTFLADVSVPTSVQASGLISASLSWKFTTGAAN